MNELAIDTKDLAKTYAGIRAVSGINLTVPPARVLGMDALDEHVAILQRTAFVSEKKTLYPSLTPCELVRFSRGFYPTWSDSAVEKYARLFEIPMKQRFEKLSNGNQNQGVAIAGALPRCGFTDFG